MEKTSSVDTTSVSKSGLVTDLNSSYVSKEQYTHARNAVRNSKEGDIGTISNEPSTIKCYSAPYKIVGIIPLPDGTDMVFSTDESNSEIGIGYPKTCEYKTVKNLATLNFSQYNQQIMGVAKKNFNKGIVATFTDKANPIRRVELNKLASLTDVDDILLFKKINRPTITLTKGNIGTVPNGTFSVAIAYSVDGQVFTDWYSITNRIQLYSSNGFNSINIEIEGLDDDFTEYSVLVVADFVDPVTQGATKAARIVGTYSTRTKNISITDFINPNYVTLPISNLLVQKETWQKAGIVSSNSNYLLFGDLVKRKEENYQPKAMTIEAEYTVEQVLADYYDTDGRDVGYYRDENYDFYIQGVYNTGELTDKFHIPGRKKKADDKTIVASDDVYEYDMGCGEERKIEKWEVKNTAGAIHYKNEEFNCGRRFLGYGEMGYFESTELYPDNIPVYGEDANKPQRFHKMPDECIVPRYEKIIDKTYINILGVRFKNIPRFDDPDIVGYIITRSDRKGGNGTVIARGIMTNIRSYQDPQQGEVMYSNYTVNDLNPDVYLSSTQTTFSNNKEHRFTPLTQYYKNRFNFYSPHTLFQPKYSLGTEVKIEAEEIADVIGQFDVVYKHPRQKLINQFAFWAALAIGYVETYYESQGLKNSVKATTSGGLSGQAFLSAGPATGPLNFDQDGPGPLGVKTSAETTMLGNGSALAISGQGVADSLSALGSIISSGNFAQLKTYIKLLKNVIKLIVSLGVKVVLTAVSIMKYANEVLNIIYGFTGYTDYVYQYNAYAKFNQSKCVGKRRGLVRPALYIPSDVVTIDDKIYNNYFREQSVYFEFNKDIDDPSLKDNTRNTISGFGICDNVTQKVKSRGVAFYATSKIPNPNQYGRIGSAAAVGMHSGVITNYEETPILYGGDCIITRFQFQKKMQFFNQNIANTNYPDGVEYDYKMYRNIAYPRFWIDSTRYDFSQLLNKKIVNYSTFSRTTAGKHNLDCKKSNDGGSITRIDNAYMYTSNNVVMDFFVECDFNPNFREKDLSMTNVNQLFRSDRLENPEKFEINRAFSDIYTTEIFAQQQRDDFDPSNPIPVNQENSVIYSLPSFNLQNVDNWQYFLPANFFAFNESDFGRLTTMQKIDQDRIMFLFSKASPFVSMGRDFLELEQSGRKVTIGDGGLFAQDPREIMPTDNNYGSSNSRFAFSNTHLGRYYPSAMQGRIMQFTEGIDDISRQGISYWCKNYMPIKLYDYFPDYPEVENPMSGVGYMNVFDSFNETVYISKRDFSPIYSDIIYEKESDRFTYKGNEINLHDSRYFKDISWTLSYSPLEKAFTSWHDWHPDLVIQRENHFSTVKGNTVWKHNEATDSFCVFYGVPHPFEIEFLSNSGQTIETVRSLEYLLEVYEYKNFGRNRFHVHHENFDRLIVHNTEQISPMLNLVYGTGDPEANLDYPKINTSTNVSWDVLYFKEENKYRVNQFFDMTKDRGEFTNAEYHLYPVDESGYKNIINPLAIDINKPEEQRKKFRHYFNKFRFIKTESGPNKFIVKLLNIKKLLSPR